MSQSPWLTIEEAASLAGVAESTIRNWVKSGRIASEMVEGTYRIDSATFRSAKILRNKHLLDCPELRALHVDERDLAGAIEAGAIVPELPTRRFSLDDRRTLASFKQGTWKQPEPTELPPPEGTEPAHGEDRLGRWPALRAYITDHHDPARMPGHFWETRLCPEFVPPAGVFRYTYGQRAEFLKDGTMMVSVKRSEGWTRDRFVPEQDGVTWLRANAWTPGAETPQFREQNLRWRALRTEWSQAWFHHRRRLLADGVDVARLSDAEPIGGRNRRELLRRYHEEHWSPSDLPDWFWDVEEPPPFEPPTWVRRFEHGTQEPDRSGQIGTWIRWTGMWQHPVGDPVYFDPPNDKLEWVPGQFEQGSTPAQYEEENQEYDLALAEWDEAYQHVQRLLRGKE